MDAQRAGGGGRIAWLDRARGLAIAGMVLFHATFDLEMAGLVAAGTTRAGVWWWLARGVAGSFILLSGFSLMIAHGRGFRRAAFERRLLRILLAALLVTAGTRAVFPAAFVYFGILHLIAAASLAGAALLRLPAAALAGLALAAALAPLWLAGDAFSHWALYWTGLAGHWPPAVDFLPFLPWVAPFLLGMAAGRVWPSRGTAAPPAAPARLPGRVLAWAGRHSLAIYLVHQPLLIGLVQLGLRAFG